FGGPVHGAHVGPMIRIERREAHGVECDRRPEPTAGAADGLTDSGEGGDRDVDLRRTNTSEGVAERVTLDDRRDSWLHGQWRRGRGPPAAPPPPHATAPGGAQHVVLWPRVDRQIARDGTAEDRLHGREMGRV